MMAHEDTIQLLNGPGNTKIWQALKNIYPPYRTNSAKIPTAKLS